MADALGARGRAQRVGRLDLPAPVLRKDDTEALQSSPQKNKRRISTRYKSIFNNWKKKSMIFQSVARSRRGGSGGGAGAPPGPSRVTINARVTIRIAG